ncbi:DNA damage-regulated autophagy modulator protein 1-like isoform X2 [Pseudophryne corroboree]|uniref:DNA damage-regulated autophagy modulator protein 1-like isoform X2 n=1 Tax=Pseudophryne corroboree TaxID=495146 RepID=UPI0030812EF4
MKGLAIVPCFWVFWSLNGLFVAFNMTLTNGHAPTYLVYISETGSFFPESVLFTVVFSVSSVLGACTVYIMYRFMTLRSTDNQTQQLLCQRILLAIGLTSCCGTGTVAMFQVITHPYIHGAGAAVAFGFGAIYNIVQSIKLYQTSFSSRRVCHVRMALSVLMVIALIIFVACKIPLLMGWCGGDQCIKHLCTQHSSQYEERKKKVTFMECTET